MWEPPRASRCNPRKLLEARAMAAPEVVFVCIHNAGRSQMSQAWMSHLSGGRVVAHSAGANDVETEAAASCARAG